jgi:hypothetical protein
MNRNWGWNIKNEWYLILKIYQYLEGKKKYRPRQYKASCNKGWERFQIEQSCSWSKAVTSHSSLHLPCLFGMDFHDLSSFSSLWNKKPRPYFFFSSFYKTMNFNNEDNQSGSPMSPISFLLIKKRKQRILDCKSRQEAVEAHFTNESLKPRKSIENYPNHYPGLLQFFSLCHVFVFT